MLALLVAAVQVHAIKQGQEFSVFFVAWVGTAAVSVGVAAIETMGRARRVHCGFAMKMIHAAAEQFLPAVIVGVMLTAVLMRAAPREVWMLPGLWQLVFSLGVFASCRFLPRQTFAVGVWYFVTGLTSLIVQSSSPTFLPWTMGIPFGFGQLLVAAILQYGFGNTFEEN